MAKYKKTLDPFERCPYCGELLDGYVLVREDGFYHDKCTYEMEDCRIFESFPQKSISESIKSRFDILDFD